MPANLSVQPNKLVFKGRNLEEYYGSVIGKDQLQRLSYIIIRLHEVGTYKMTHKLSGLQC